MNKRCGDPECNKQASFGSEPKKPLFCFEHKRDEMVNVCNKMCEHEGCMKTPKFGLIEKRPTHCKEHSSSNMVDVAHKLCETDGCEKRASYGFESQRPLYCAKHAKEVPETRDVVTGKCKQAECLIKPSYGLPGSNPEYCKKHKSDEMSFHGKTCLYSDCHKQPTFGHAGNAAVYCAAHKLDNMVDVHNVICTIEDCCLHASYGYNISNILWCSYHGKSQDPPASLQKGKKCERPGCVITATFCFKGGRRQYCEKHKEPNMISYCYEALDCASCGLCYPKTSLDQSLLCLYCRPATFLRSKEAAIGQLLKKEFPERNFVHNSYTIDQIHHAHLRYRPDFWLELVSHILIIEVDEFAHSSRDRDCEIVRMINIAMSCGGKPVTFIRYNPDGKEVSTKTRQKALVQLIYSSLSSTSEDLLQVKYLFYKDSVANEYQNKLRDRLAAYLK